MSMAWAIANQGSQPTPALIKQWQMAAMAETQMMMEGNYSSLMMVIPYS